MFELLFVFGVVLLVSVEEFVELLLLELFKSLMQLSLTTFIGGRQQPVRRR